MKFVLTSSCAQLADRGGGILRNCITPCRELTASAQSNVQCTCDTIFDARIRAFSDKATVTFK